MTGRHKRLEEACGRKESMAARYSLRSKGPNDNDDSNSVGTDTPKVDQKEPHSYLVFLENWPFF